VGGGLLFINIAAVVISQSRSFWWRARNLLALLIFALVMPLIVQEF
jgi:hypothetical protein